MFSTYTHKTSSRQKSFIKMRSSGLFELKIKIMETTQRQTYLDWLRILSILGVLFFHSAMPYDQGDWWHIKNKETSDLMMEVVFFMHQVRMPLLFFISGPVSYYMSQNTT